MKELKGKVAAVTGAASGLGRSMALAFGPDGAIYITDTDADLVRIEGLLAKSPSFWPRRVEVVKQYARVGGLRVPIRVESTAQIRFAGASTMTMTYDYEMINGVNVASSQAVVALAR